MLGPQRLDLDERRIEHQRAALPDASHGVADGSLVEADKRRRADVRLDRVVHHQRRGLRQIGVGVGALLDVPDDVDASVRARMERQRLLYEGGPSIEILIGEAALRHPVGSPAVMAAQLDRLGSALGLPGVRIGVLPFGRQLPYVPWHGFWIVDDTVFVENITAEVRVTDETEVTIYHRLADALWTVAVEGDEARALLASVATTLG